MGEEFSSKNIRKHLETYIWYTVYDEYPVMIVLVSCIIS